MKEKKPRHPPNLSHSRKRPLKEDERALWNHVTQDVAPLSSREGTFPEEQDSAEVFSETPISPVISTSRRKKFVPHPEPFGQILTSPAPPPPSPAPSSRQIDRNLQKSFAKGELPVDGQIDLHGLTLDQAHKRFMAFLHNKIHTGARFLLVITGKGTSVSDPVFRGHHTEEHHERRGIIRRNLPHWCEDPSVKPFILQTLPAQPHHGGAGCTYILLRRKRSL